MSLPNLITTRLTLRDWSDEDVDPFVAMNSDAQVMEYMPACMSRDETQQMLQRLQTHVDTHGFGLWALEHQASHAFMGYVGLLVPSFEAHFTPCVEIGWRLAAAHWGQGYATEAARAVLRHAFLSLHLPEVVSFTVPDNTRSRRVMEKLGMTYNQADNFAHPRLAKDHPLSAHVLYRLSAQSFGESR